MAMRIAVISHVRHPVRQPFMGGLEAHSWHLVRALRERGHEVTLFASGDSDHEPVPILDIHYDRDFPWHDHHGTEALNRHVDAGFAGTMRQILDGGFDVVHNNSVHRYPPRLARQHRVPTVTSLHVPPFDALRRAVRESSAPWSRFTVTSDRQVESWWPREEVGCPPEAASVVHNGVDTEAFPFVAEGDGSAVWAGRITPNKGTHFAITAAQFANIPLTIYGAIERQDYFDRMIAPYLGGFIRYGGHLTGNDLAQAIGRASVFLFTPLWDEPFGLAAVEAMSCGVPVAAIDNGAVREIVGEEAGRFARPNEPAALGLAAKRAMRIDRRVPRARVEEMFTIGRMVDAYEALYDQAQDGLSEDAPAVEFPPVELRIAERRPLAAE
jgi:glycosyltransferase involved in cell wall biosynthesis